MKLRSRTDDSLRLRLGDQAALLDNQSPRQIRQITQFVKSSESLDGLGILFLNAAPNLENHTSTLVYVHNISRRWPKKSRDFESLIKGASHIIRASSIDEFKKLDEITQKEIWETYLVKSTDYNPIRPCADKAFLRLVTATGFPITARKLLVPTVAAEYIEQANLARYVRVSQHSTTSKVDYSLPTDEFLQKAQEYSNTYHANPSINVRPGPSDSTLEPYRTQIVLMLRALYGEVNVLGVLERFSTSPTLLCPNEMIDLLEDWENLRQYPSDWIAQIRHLEHTR